LLDAALSFGDLSLRRAFDVARGGQLRLGLGNRRPSGFGIRARRIHLRLRNGLVFAERLGPCEVGVRARRLSFGAHERRLGRLDLRFSRSGRCRGSGKLRSCRRQPSLGHRFDDSNLRVSLLRLSSCGGELGLSLLRTRGQIGRVEFHKGVALLHGLVVRNRHLAHDALHASRNGDCVGLDLRVVGAFLSVRKPRHDTVPDGSDREHRAQNEIGTRAPRGRRASGFSRCFGYSLGARRRRH
jgi:hypothetical protein